MLKSAVDIGPGDGVQNGAKGRQDARRGAFAERAHHGFGLREHPWVRAMLVWNPLASTDSKVSGSAFDSSRANTWRPASPACRVFCSRPMRRPHLPRQARHRDLAMRLAPHCGEAGQRQIRLVVQLRQQRTALLGRRDATWLASVGLRGERLTVERHWRLPLDRRLAPPGGRATPPWFVPSCPACTARPRWSKLYAHKAGPPGGPTQAAPTQHADLGGCRSACVVRSNPGRAGVRQRPSDRRAAQSKAVRLYRLTDNAAAPWRTVSAFTRPASLKRPLEKPSCSRAALVTAGKVKLPSSRAVQ